MNKEKLIEYIKDFAFSVALGAALTGGTFWSILLALKGVHSWFWVALDIIVICADFIDARYEWENIKAELEKIERVLNE